MCSGRHKHGKRPSACTAPLFRRRILHSASKQDSVVVQGRILQELLFPVRQQGWDKASLCGADVLGSTALVTLCLSDEGAIRNGKELQPPMIRAESTASSAHTKLCQQPQSDLEPHQAPETRGMAKLDMPALMEPPQRLLPPAHLTQPLLASNIQHGPPYPTSTAP